MAPLGNLWPPYPVNLLHARFADTVDFPDRFCELASAVRNTLPLEKIATLWVTYEP